MSAPDDDTWPDWPADGLEHLGHCPVCGSLERTLLYKDLTDRLYGAPGKWTMYLCAGCGSGYLDPRPNRETIGLAYANYETHRPAVASPPTDTDTRLRVRLRNGYLNSKYGYCMQPASRWGYLAMHLLPPPWRLEWDHYARHLKPPTPGHNKLLDVGCGNGEFLLRARSQGWEVHGLDFDAEALSHARKTGIEVRHGAVESQQFPKNSFDAITCHQVIEHVHAPLATLQTIFKWLKPKGHVWIGTPNIKGRSHSIFGRHWYLLSPPAHLQIFSHDAIIWLLSEAGFSKIQILPRGYAESHYYRASAKLKLEEIAKNRSTAHQQARSFNEFILETLCWVNPTLCSDMVVTAQK